MSLRLSSTLLLPFLLTWMGCSSVGTTAIRKGRASYNDALVQTNNEQLLAMIVRMRYEEPAGLLAVEGITANVRFRASANAEVGIGSSDDYEGNLVPLSAGALYEESPTISYTPVQGQEHMRLMLTPVPLDLAILLLDALGDSPRAVTLLVREINEIRHPDLGYGSATDAARFAEVAALLASLHRRGSLTWVQDPHDPSSFALLLRGSGEVHAREVARLRELLGLTPSQTPESVVLLPVLAGVRVAGTDSIEVRTRSIYELFRIAAACVDVPREHLESGLAPGLPLRGAAARPLRIRRSRCPPKDALVATDHHGWWFYIDATDGSSKETFKVLETLVSARIADSTGGRPTRPVLTVPVSR